MEKENERFVSNVDTTSSLKETLKAIRKPNATANDCEPYTEEAGEKSSKNTPVTNIRSDIDDGDLTRVRNKLKDENLVENSDITGSKSNSVDSEVISTIPKFVPPKRFISPLLTGQFKDPTSNASHSGGAHGNADNNITTHYYSVVW